MEAADWFSSSTDDAGWDFAQECLLLLLTLARHLSAELKVFQQTPAASAPKYCTPENAPPLPPDVLSVTQQKMLGTALQFVVSLGLCPYLAPGVGVALGHRSAFAAMVEKLVCNGAVTAVGCRLLTTTKVLLQLTELSSLATLVFTRHLGDVMAALCQLGYQPHQEDRSGTKERKVTYQCFWWSYSQSACYKGQEALNKFLLQQFCESVVFVENYFDLCKNRHLLIFFFLQDLSAEERQTCREALESLVGKVYQPIVIKELLILQGGPKQVIGNWKLCANAFQYIMRSRIWHQAAL